MYYKEIPKDLLERFQKPIESYTEEAVSKRLNLLFPARWKSEFSNKQLFAITIPMVGPRGMEILTTVPIWLIQNTITILIGREEQITRTSYLITPIFNEESKKDNEKLAFVNTALRGLSIGIDDRKMQSLSLEKEVLGRKLFFSERVNDYIFDTEAVKVILAKEEEKAASDRRAAPRKTLSMVQSIPVVITVDRHVMDGELFLLDFSSSGLKIISSFDFPQNKPFTLTLKLDEPLSLWCEVVWKSVLWEDLHHIGIKFVKLQLDKFERLCRYVEEVMPRKDEGGMKISRVLSMELGLWEQPKRLPTFFHSLSPEEMRIMFPSYLQQGIKAHCRIYPAWNVAPIEGDVEVMSSTVLKEGGCLAVLAYRNLPEQSRAMMENFLQKCAIDERHRAG